MTDKSFPITPPPTELVTQWTAIANEEEGCKVWSAIAAQAAQWGWDQRDAATETELQKARDEELAACEEWVAVWISAPEASELYAARRPKPPSLKKQAYAALDTYIYGEPDPKDKERTYNTIRLALEQLND